MAAPNSFAAPAPADECPLVTIAIPTRNRAALLARAAASALAQTHPRVEVLVSDNASTDDTPAELERLERQGVRVFRQPENLGMVGNWNALLMQARGEYFVNLSDDDYLEPEFAAQLAGALRANPGVSLAHAAVTFHDEANGKSWQPRLAPEVEEGWQTILHAYGGRRAMLPSFMMIRSADLRTQGGYNADFGIGADWAAWLPLALKGGVQQPPHRLGHYKLHAENLSNRPVHLIEASLRIAGLSEEEASKARLPEEIQGALRAASRRWVAQQTANILAKHIQLGHSRADVWGETRKYFSLLSADPARALAPLLAAFLLPQRAHATMRTVYRFFAARTERESTS